MGNINVFFFFITLTLSSTIHARDSQFFNKFSTNIPQPLNTNQQPQQQPEFIPQSQDSNSYGLYGHESGKLPPSTTTTNNQLPSYLPENYNPVAYTTPIHSNTQDIPNEYKAVPQPSYNSYNAENNRMYNSENQEEFMGTNGGDMYSSEKQGFDDASFMETTQDGGNMYNLEKQVGMNGRYNSERQVNMGDARYSTSNNGNMYNSEKQGMSDTRFLENGKYYYDVNMENLNSNANMNTRGYNSRNEYNTQGYYGNKQNSYDRYNSYSSGGGYQDEEDQFNP